MEHFHFVPLCPCLICPVHDHIHGQIYLIRDDELYGKIRVRVSSSALVEYATPHICAVDLSLQKQKNFCTDM